MKNVDSTEKLIRLSAPKALYHSKQRRKRKNRALYRCNSRVHYYGASWGRDGKRASDRDKKIFMIRGLNTVRESGPKRETTSDRCRDRRDKQSGCLRKTYKGRV
jgi:hypothetical protein